MVVAQQPSLMKPKACSAERAGAVRWQHHEQAVQADILEQERAQCPQCRLRMGVPVLQRQQLGAARVQRLQADMQLVQQCRARRRTHPAPAGRCPAPGVSDACGRGSVPLRQCRRTAAALATVVEQAPARQVGALERAQGDRRGLQLQQMAAQHGRSGGGVGGGVIIPGTMAASRSARPFKSLQKRGGAVNASDSVQA
jgi:hypothetical protein